MKRLKITLIVAAFSTIFTVPSLHANEALARANGCLACHGLDKKIVGPGFQEIAAKYKDDASAAATLVAKVKDGGGGNWGQVPMPPNAHVSDTNIRSLVAWILSL